MTYKCKYFPKNPSKYDGNPKAIFCRSAWEMFMVKWLDENAQILKWGSEEIRIPYKTLIGSSKKNRHTYYVDFHFLHKSNPRVHLIEIKPKSQTIQPKPGARKDLAYAKKVFTWIKNNDKWDAAKAWANAKGYIFQVWTEDQLVKLGIMPPLKELYGRQKR